MKTETQETPTINLADLTPQQRKALLKEAMAEEKELKSKNAGNLAAYKELSQLFVNDNVDIFVHRQNAIEDDIKKLFTNYQAILNLKAMAYGDKVLEQDSHTSTLTDGSASITIGNNVSIGFDGTESIGIQGIKEFITTLAADDENTIKLTEMVNILLKPNKLGQLNPSSIIQLNSLRELMKSEKFNTNLDIIVDAQIRVASTMYASGWKVIELADGIKKKIIFRFSI